MIPSTVQWRTVGNETVLMDLETSTYHSLNSVGGRFWALVAEGKDFEQIISTLVGEYSVDRAQLEADLRELSAELQNLKLLRAAA
jgi:hypothetical protein